MFFRICHEKPEAVRTSHLSICSIIKVLQSHHNFFSLARTIKPIQLCLLCPGETEVTIHFILFLLAPSDQLPVPFSSLGLYSKSQPPPVGSTIFFLWDKPGFECWDGIPPLKVAKQQEDKQCLSFVQCIGLLSEVSNSFFPLANSSSPSIQKDTPKQCNAKVFSWHHDLKFALRSSDFTPFLRQFHQVANVWRSSSCKIPRRLLPTGASCSSSVLASSHEPHPALTSSWVRSSLPFQWHPHSPNPLP